MYIYSYIYIYIYNHRTTYSGSSSFSTSCAPISPKNIFWVFAHSCEYLPVVRTRLRAMSPVAHLELGEHREDVLWSEQLEDVLGCEQNINKCDTSE